MLCLGWLLFCVPVPAQSQLSGRVLHRRYPGGDVLYLSTVMVFASPRGEGGEARAFRTWETHPAGWYLITGPPGEYTVWFTQPGGFFRPVVLSPVVLRDGEKLDGLDVTPSFDDACFDESAWDNRPATDYYQVFKARGRTLTAVGIRLAHDGVDGAGPGSQTLVATVHRAGNGTPDQWPQVGPPGVIPKVDCGGPKNYIYATGWDSGEVLLTPGETYAVRIRAEKEGGVMQTFWRSNTTAEPSLYRVGKDGTRGWVAQRLWLAVATDADDFVIPYNKKIHSAYQEFAGFARKWSQTYVARGTSLAGVTLFAAVGGTQPPLSRQRVRVRVREGGPQGAVIGVEKIAIGNGNYTGDASWGMFGAAYARGEVPLKPGNLYALEFESIENYETLHGFVNIKGDVSDDRPGFNPYKKVAPDDYKHGTSYKHGQEEMHFDLDMQVVEYGSPIAPAPNLLMNGHMQQGEGDFPAGWVPYKKEPATKLLRFADGPANTNFTARVIGGSATGARADGGFVQRIAGLNRFAAYRLKGKIRSSWPLDWQHQTMVGVDPTGQTEDPDAPTVLWSKGPPLHGLYVDYQSVPVRPLKDSISIWLRGRTTLTNDYRFTADFDDFELRLMVE